MTTGGVKPIGSEAWLDHRVRSAALFVLFLDFDGTLAEIVEGPQRVRLAASAAEVLARLVGRTGTKVTVISGRTLEDLKRHIPVPGLYLAGNHGLEADGPAVRFLHPQAAGRVAEVDALAAKLQTELAHIPGVLVENKGLSVACHNRSVPTEALSTFWTEVRSLLPRDVRNWRVVAGKRVVEILPAPGWTKGSCARFLRLHFEEEATGSPVAFAVAIGDDHTDRDMLTEVRGDGFAVAVGKSLGPGWDLRLSGVQAVHRLLDRFDRLRSREVVPSS